MFFLYLEISFISFRIITKSNLVRTTPFSCITNKPSPQTIDNLNGPKGTNDPPLAEPIDE